MTTLDEDPLTETSDEIADRQADARSQLRQRALKRGMEKRQPGQVCPECETVRWVDTPEEDGRTACRPCSLCLPVRYDWWVNGHGVRDHNKDACDHELCTPRRLTRRK
jgi:hypothetical protein